MALSGLHVACGFVGGYGRSQAGSVASSSIAVIPLLSKAVWSETLASAATTTSSAPAGGNGAGAPVFTIRSSIDAWVAIGVAPDATIGPRRLIPAGTDVHLFVDSGDKLAWVAA
ncbi:hypothetical protein [Aureimonas sp. AU20]|uniref:hypothetical protein n=1 Tax=Aureimonas sp. AU20 TaxID=1349819 RepID=UPI000720B059|nr:hypothetical protein [Aureimonas sp. AU20]ALN73519.1 hypothetical protein M673_12412 [Aureimonas sp. AU20]